MLTQTCQVHPRYQGAGEVTSCSALVRKHLVWRGGESGQIKVCLCQEEANTPSGVLHSQTTERPSDGYSLGPHQEVVRGQTPQRCLSTLNSFLQTSISTCLAPLPPHYRATAEQEETALQTPPHPGVLCPGSWDSCEQTLQVGLSRVLAQLQGELPGLMALAAGCNCIQHHTTPPFIQGLGEMSTA